MLKTEFRAVLVGFETQSQSDNGSRPGQGKMYQYLPPRPPQIHQAVYRCDPSEVIAFSEQLDFLRILLQVQGVPMTLTPHWKVSRQMAKRNELLNLASSIV